MSLTAISIDPFSAEVASRLSPDANGVVKVNFHKVFGTAGCLLHCGQRYMFQNQRYNSESDPRGSKATRRNENKRTAQKLNDLTFTWTEIKESIAKGCGSCHMLSMIMEAIFSGSDMGQHHYGVSPSFVITRIVDDVNGTLSDNSLAKTTEIPLFQPKGEFISFAAPRGVVLNYLLIDEKC
jgi:hypothetical protein